MDINYQFGIFKFESGEERVFNELRTIKTKDGDVLFCSIDVARMLGYANPSKDISDHCKRITKREVPCKSGSYTNKGRCYVGYNCLKY